jgi:hypothetical protein
MFIKNQQAIYVRTTELFGKHSGFQNDCKEFELQNQKAVQSEPLSQE